MRWIPFLILVYLVVLVQTTLGRLLMFPTEAVGTIGPDLAVLVVVFVALHGRSWVDVMLATWALGLAVDLATAGGPGGPTVVGPMAIAYSVTGGLLFRMREAFFREQALTQALLAVATCFVAHLLWLTAQAVLAAGAAHYWRSLGQAVLVACYTGLLMPLAHYGLARCRRWFLAAPSGPARRARR